MKALLLMSLCVVLPALTHAGDRIILLGSPRTCDGEIRGVNSFKPMSVDVVLADGSKRKFELFDATKIITKTNSNAPVRDLKLGDPVTVRYSTKDEKYYAVQIEPKK